MADLEADNSSWGAWNTTSLLQRTEPPGSAFSLTSLILPAVLLTIFIIGLLGNGTLIIIFIMQKKMRSVPNTYVFSLAIGDLVMISTSLPFISLEYIMHPFLFGDTICKLSETSHDVSVGVSVFTFTAMAAERYLSVADPLRSLSFPPGHPVTRSMAIWGMSVLFATTTAVTAHVQYVSNGLAVCAPFPDEWDLTMVLVRFTVYYAVPLAIMAGFYLMLVRQLLHTTCAILGQHAHHARQVRERRKVAKSVMATVTVFAVCFLPDHIFAIWFYWFGGQLKYNNVMHSFRILGFCMGLLNSCANPIALYCVSSSFRRALKRFPWGSCFKCRRPPTRTSLPSSHATPSHGTDGPSWSRVLHKPDCREGPFSVKVQNLVIDVAAIPLKMRVIPKYAVGKPTSMELVQLGPVGRVQKARKTSQVVVVDVHVDVVRDEPHPGPSGMGTSRFRYMQQTAV